MNANQEQAAVADGEPVVPNKQKWRPGILTYALVVLLVIGGGVPITHLIWTNSARNQLELELDAIRASGAPVHFAEVEPEPIPEELDGTPFLVRAAQIRQRIVQQGGKAGYEKFDSFSRLFPSRIRVADRAQYHALDAEQLVLIDEIASEHADALELIPQALAKGRVRLPHDYDARDPQSMILGNLDAIQQISFVIRAQAESQMARDDHAAALNSIEQLLALGHIAREEPFMVSQHVRFGVFASAVDALEHYLAVAKLSDDEFQRLDDLLAEIDAGFNPRFVLEAERAAVLTTMKNFDVLDREVREMDFDDPADDWTSWRYWNLPALRYKDQAFAMRMMGQAIDALEQPGALARLEEIESSDALAIATDSEPKAEKLLGPEVIPAFSHFLRNTLQTRQMLMNARWGTRVARRIHVTGSLPASLDEVADDALSPSPGLLSRLPLVYRATETGFVIYDIGSNGVDDRSAEARDDAEAETYPRDRDEWSTGVVVRLR